MEDSLSVEMHRGARKIAIAIRVLPESKSLSQVSNHLL